MILFFLVVTATFQPVAPTVGDPITIQFAAPVTLNSSPQFEIVSQQPTVVVIRSFQPKPFPISGRVGDTYFRNMVVPMKSVLKPNDTMEPAPLQPPMEPEYPRAPFIAIATAAGLALLTWAAVWWLARRKAVASMPELAMPPAD